MKILVLGAGATGGYYGGRLAASGADVMFLVRDKRFNQLQRDGIQIKSPFGDVSVPIKCVTRETVRDTYNLIILSCKSYDLDSAIEAITPALNMTSLVLPLLNGMRHLETLDAAFAAQRVLGGMCHLSVTLADDGVIHHLNNLHLLTYGPRQESQAAACAAFLPVLQKANFENKLSTNVIGDMWGKWVLLASLAGMTCLMRANVGEIAAASDGKSLMLALIDECAAVATANGAEPSREALAQIKSLLTDPQSSVVASMLRDMQRGANVEGDHIIGDMLERAKSAQVPAPMLAIAYANLQVYQNRLASRAG